jgi:hypothetical protein
MNREVQRQIILGDFSPEMLRDRQAAGWRVAAIEWVRDTEEHAESGPRIDPPFGMRVAGDCAHLEEEPGECEVLRTVMRMIVHDEPLSKITLALNERGHRTRAGQPWTEAAVFALMPVIVDHGPRIFADARWTAAGQPRH